MNDIHLSSTEKVYQELHHRLRHSYYAYGEWIRESHVAQELEVSRTATREAMYRLLGEGALTRNASSGAFLVPVPTQKTLQEIQQLREILETSALQLAATTLTKTNIKTLRSIARQYARFTKKGYFLGAAEADLRFHETLITLSRNSRLVHAYQQAHIFLFLRMANGQPINDFEQAHAEHLAIIDALACGNIPLAIETLRKQLRRGAELATQSPAHLSQTPRKRS